MKYALSILISFLFINTASAMSEQSCEGLAIMGAKIAKEKANGAPLNEIITNYDELDDNSEGMLKIAKKTAEIIYNSPGINTAKKGYKAIYDKCSNNEKNALLKRLIKKQLEENRKN